MTIREAKRIRVGDWVCVKNLDGTCQQSQKVVRKASCEDSIYLQLADGKTYHHVMLVACHEK